MIRNCPFCEKSIEYEKPQQMGGHITSCVLNPNRKVRIDKIVQSKRSKQKYELECKKCKKIYTVNSTVEAFNKGRYQKHCSRKCANSHVRTEESKQKQSKKAIQHYESIRSGEEILKICSVCEKSFNLPYNKRYRRCCTLCSTVDGKHSDVFKHKLSQLRKGYLEKNPEKHPNRLCAGIQESYPERFLREFFEQQGLVKNIDFKQQYKIEEYFLDFYLPKLNLGIEVDGERWHGATEREQVRECILKEQVELVRFKAKPLIKKEYQPVIEYIIMQMTHK